MNFLIKHKKIKTTDIFTYWESGAEPVAIANELDIEKEDVQSYLKENLEKLKRKNSEDLWQLDRNYYDD